MLFQGSLDTNTLLRLLLNDIPEQHKAIKKLVSQARGQFNVADTAIIELAFVLERHYDFSRQQVKEAITGLTQLKEISCNHILCDHALLLYIAHPALSFEDCCLSSYAALNQAEPLWTFDKKLARQAVNATLINS